MNSHEKSYKYFFKDDKGFDAFFIHLEFDEVNLKYYLSTSIGTDLNNYFEYQKMSDQIISENNEFERILLIKKLAQIIKQYDSLNLFYFPNEILNSNGRYMNENAKVLYQIISENMDFPDYTVFSENHNSIYFYELKTGKLIDFISKIHNEITKQEWELLICESQQLKIEYVEYLTDDNGFVQTEGKLENGIHYNYYLMFDKNLLKLFFVKRII